MAKVLGRLAPGETFDEVSFIQAAREVCSRGPVLYAIRLSDGTIKIGWTSDLYHRWHRLASRDGAEQILGFTWGTRADETELHRSLTGHAVRGREYYRPDPEVLAVVNAWRRKFGRDPIAS